MIRWIRETIGIRRVRISWPQPSLSTTLVGRMQIWMMVWTVGWLAVWVSVYLPCARCSGAYGAKGWGSNARGQTGAAAASPAQMPAAVGGLPGAVQSPATRPPDLRTLAEGDAGEARRSTSPTQPVTDESKRGTEAK